MGTVLNFIRPDKKLENIQANRIAFFHMDESFAEFIKKVEGEEYQILGVEWNEDNPCNLALVLSHKDYEEKVEAPQVEKLEAIEAPVPTQPITEKRPTLGQIIEKYIGEEVDKKNG